MARSHRDVSWSVKQQLIDDEVSGLMLRFEMLPTGEPVLRIYGAMLPHGNRVIRFSSSGELSQMATSVLGIERPNWPQNGMSPTYRPTVSGGDRNSSMQTSVPSVRKPR